MRWIKKLFGRREDDPGTPVVTRGRSTTGPPDDALLDALTRVYGDQVPFHLGVGVTFADGGPDPLDGVSIYGNEHGPHWHYVSFGMAEVMSAELTFRHAAKPSDIGEPDPTFRSIAHHAPTWPIQMLNMLARRVHRTGRAFGVGHWWEGPPGVLRPYTELRHLAFARDPELGAVSVRGREITFLQAVGVTAETVEGMKADERAGRGDATLEALQGRDPLLVTDPAAFLQPSK